MISEGPARSSAQDAPTVANHSIAFVYFHNQAGRWPNAKAKNNLLV